MKLFLTFLCAFCLLFSIKLNAQTDTLFWFAAPDLSAGHEQTPNVFKICTYNKAATVTISQPANSAFQPITVQLAPNSTQIVDITNRIALIENTQTNIVENKGIKISSTAFITCYYEVGIRNNPEIFVLKGNSGFGKKFLIPAQTRFQNFGYTPLQKKGFIITALFNETVITITPKNAVVGHQSGIPFIIRLNAGETYTVNAIDGQAASHVGGCEVSAEKNICITTYEDSVQSSPCADLIGDQIIPENRAGNEYILVRGQYVASTNNAIPQDFYFIYPIENNTNISIDGTLVATRNRGESFSGSTINIATYITANKPILVMQVSGFGCEFTGTTLPSIACTGSQNITFIRSTSEPFVLNLLCKTTEINSFEINKTGNIINPNWFVDVAGTNGIWKAARLSSEEPATQFLNSFIIENAATNISNTSGVFHLGFLNGDTRTGGRLGYFSDYTIGNLNPQITSQQCSNSNIQLLTNKITNATYAWSGPNGFTSTINNPTIINATLQNVGKYYITTTAPGCGSYNDSIDVNVYFKPTIQILKDTAICQQDTALLTVQLQGKAPFSFTYDNSNFSNITNNTVVFKEAPSSSKTFNITNTTDAEGCAAPNPNFTDILSATITVLPTPTGIIIGLDSMSIGDMQTIQFLFTGMPPFNLMYRANNQIIAVNNINSNSYTTSISPIQNTLYQIVSLSNGSICEASIKDSLFVKVTPKKPIIPNAFSPNGDGINDTWILKNMLGYPNAEIIVFNRYGQPVYTTKNYNTANAFNGKYNNIPLPVGTYYYVINLQNKTAPLHGAVTILR